PIEDKEMHPARVSAPPNPPMGDNLVPQNGASGTPVDLGGDGLTDLPSNVPPVEAVKANPYRYRRQEIEHNLLWSGDVIEDGSRGHILAAFRRLGRSTAEDAESEEAFFREYYEDIEDRER